MTSTEYEHWLGRSETVTEVLSLTVIDRICATLNQPRLSANDHLPHLWQWCFFQSTLPACDLGRDGHPALGGFLPPAEGRNRMWAGGRLKFLQPLLADQSAERKSTIIAITEKEGGTGKLLFVTLKHLYVQHGQVCIEEEQDIVYREPSPPKTQSRQAKHVADWQERHDPTTTDLFRYSAVTYNGHRIHYDFNYATEVEGYSGLVTHGPLIATLSLQAFKNANPEAHIHEFSYRGVRPIICGQAFTVAGRITAPGSAELEASNDSGVAQEARVVFTSSAQPAV